MTRLIIVAIPAIFTILYLSKMIKGRAGETPEIRNLVLLKSGQWSVEPALIRAIIRVESNFNPRAKNPADPSYGLMQITPGLASDFGLIADPFSPTRQEINMLYDEANNMDVGCWYLSRLTSKYPFDEAVQMYNVGETGYKKGVRNLSYLEKVKRHYEQYS